MIILLSIIVQLLIAGCVLYCYCCADDPSEWFEYDRIFRSGPGYGSSDTPARPNDPSTTTFNPNARASAPCRGCIDSASVLRNTYSGSTRTSGPTGTSGTARISGTARTSGATGTSGTTRISGALGTSGTARISGTVRISGTTRTSGATGTSGAIGTSGTAQTGSRNNPIGRPGIAVLVNPQQQPGNINRTSGNITTTNNNPNHHHQQNPTESVEQLQFRKTVLRHFKCPFDEEEACRFKDNPQQCFFTHVGSDGTGATNLKDVPAYACIYHLINSCRSVSNNLTTASQNPNSIQNILPCINGIHLSVIEMVDLEYYERANRRTIRLFFGSDVDRQCCVCLETVLSKRLSRTRRFAILENCVHCFCVQCIVEWRSRNLLTCPLCRTVSERVVYRRRFTDKPEKKRELFR